MKKIKQYKNFEDLKASNSKEIKKNYQISSIENNTLKSFVDLLKKHSVQKTSPKVKV